MGSDTASARELRDALLEPLPRIPSKYFYDDRGSELFEQITRVPEYYPTRTEEAILEADASRIIQAVRPRELVELGSGAGRKIRMLLDAMAREDLLERCLLLEFNELFLLDSLTRLQASYPDLDLRGIRGDFERDLVKLGEGGDRLILFLAGTIGNLLPEDAARFVERIARQMSPGDGFLVGVDLVKDKARLDAAYYDALGVTAAFNLNILTVVNREFDADFAPDAFEHVAFFDVEKKRIEMRVRATRPSHVRVAAADVDLDFAAGDEILTEVSCKYTRNSASALAAVGGLVLEGWFTDPEQLFALALMRKR